MTLDETIEELTKEREECIFKGMTRLPKALQIGIEAVKRIQYRRREIGSWDDALLPGETEEEK